MSLEQAIESLLERLSAVEAKLEAIEELKLGIEQLKTASVIWKIELTWKSRMRLIFSRDQVEELEEFRSSWRAWKNSRMRLMTGSMVESRVDNGKPGR